MATPIVMYKDFRYKDIPNWIPVSIFLAGLLLSLLQGWREVANAMVSALLGFGILLILYLVNYLGGGDVKLMGAFGALLGGWHLAFEALIYTLLAGGVFALFYLLPGMIKGTFSRSSEMPFGPAICIGVLMELLIKVQSS